MNLSLTQEKVDNVLFQCNEALKQQEIQILFLTKLVGTLASTVQAVLPARIQFRYLQQEQIQALKRQGTYKGKVTLGELAKLELKWWIENLIICNGRKVHQKEPKFVVQTDASKTGLGAYCRGVPTGELGQCQKGLTI